MNVSATAKKVLHVGKYFPPHAGGMETYLYEELTKLIPEVRRVTVDVRKWLKAPPKHERVRARFPDPRVISQVKGSCNFKEALGACLDVLREQGIVVVACKSGVHRAATVAEAVQDYAKKPYIVHCCVDKYRLKTLYEPNTCRKV